MPVLMNLNREKNRNHTKGLKNVLAMNAPQQNSNLITNGDFSSALVSPISERAITPFYTSRGIIHTDKKLRKNFFPQKLMEMLSSPFFSDCIAWTSEGNAFFISEPQNFLNKYASFYRMKNTALKESFARKLNRWGFKMELAKGPYCGSYSHPLFTRDEPWRCIEMACVTKRRLSQTESPPSLEKENRPKKKKKLERGEKMEHQYSENLMKTVKKINENMSNTACTPSDTDKQTSQHSNADKDLLLKEVYLRRQLATQRMMNLICLQTMEPSTSLTEVAIKNAIMALL